MVTSKPANRVERQSSRIEWVALDKMRVREGVSQRVFRPDWAEYLANHFKLEHFDTPHVNKVGEWYWIMDGQHSIAALKQWLGDWKGQSVECRVYRNLSEQQEAEFFLSLNDVKAVRAFDKFKSGLTAQREDELNISAVVHKLGLNISEQGNDTSVRCVSALRRVYRQTGMDGLAQTLEIASGAFGKEGLQADMLRGVGLLPGRYNGLLETKRAINTLGALRGGANQIRSRSERLRHQFGVNKAQAIAAACVEAYNRGKGGKKLPSWWKSES
jgi:hypothetical protein